MRMLTLILVAGLFLSSCAVKYGPLTATGGYSESFVEHDVAEVSFEGNNSNSKEQINDYLLFRCAELTLEKGYSHFLILKDESQMHVDKNEYSNSGIALQQTSTASGGSQNRVTYGMGADDYSTARTGSYVIQMLKGPHPVYVTASLDARSIIDEKTSRIKRR